MSSFKVKIIEYLSGLGLILVMLCSVAFFHDQEILLPEIAAMTAGMWIYHEPSWIHTPRKITTVPTITASIGFLVNRIHWNYLPKIIVTAFLMLGVLRVAQIYITPALATGFFPIIVNATHWSFLISIVVATIILMLGVKARQVHQHSVPEINYKYQYVFISVFITWSIITSLSGKPHMAAIPPIIVVFFEVLQKDHYPLTLAGKHILVLTFSATLGFGVHLIVTSWMISTLITLPTVFIVLNLFKIKLPAAYAFPLLALILPNDMFSTLPISTLLASLFFFSLAYLYKRLENAKRLLYEES